MNLRARLFAEPRPVRALGDLFANVWQIAYVTRDLDRGMEELRDRFGVEHCVEVPTAGATFLRGDEPAEWEARIAMGARGGLIVELIEPVAGEVHFYRRFLPGDGSPALRLHHLATFVALGEDVWSSLTELLAASGLKVDYTVLIPDRVRAGYVDTTAELGHFLEVCQLQEADIEFFSGLVEQSA
jgi:Glyoxalase/Bleomycin resistance protein/Dioxygenase superfamily